jgi:hypothetical protein
MTALTVVISPTVDGWGVYRSDGLELARYRGFFAKQRALRFAFGFPGRVPARRSKHPRR